MSAPHIIHLVEESLLASEPVEYLPAPEKILSGHPRQRVWSHYTDASQKFSVGIWECEPGAWRVRYTEEEYCRVVMGRSLLTSADGVVREVVAGDEFVIPRGFEGAWEVLERTRKVYVIYEGAE
jgi:uncharacterized cupin superfamily protein